MEGKQDCEGLQGREQAGEGNPERGAQHLGGVPLKELLILIRAAARLAS